MWIRVALWLALCLHTCQDLAVAGSLGSHVRPAPASRNHASWTTVPAGSGREVRVGDSTNICGGTVLQLRGGGRGHPKATADEYTTVEGIELTDQQVLSPHICSRMRRAPFGMFDCMHDCTHSMRTRTFIMRWWKTTRSDDAAHAKSLDLRRHWKRKPEWLEVIKDGTKKLIKTKTILNVMKDRERLEQKRRKCVPMHIICVRMCVACVPVFA